MPTVVQRKALTYIVTYRQGFLFERHVDFSSETHGTYGIPNDLEVGLRFWLDVALWSSILAHGSPLQQHPSPCCRLPLH